MHLNVSKQVSVYLNLFHLLSFPEDGHGSILLSFYASRKFCFYFKKKIMAIIINIYKSADLTEMQAFLSTSPKNSMDRDNNKPQNLK